MQAVNDNETQALRSAESYVEVAPKTYRILFTRGDELMTPTAFRGSFERAMERSLVAENDIADEYVARAFAVSVTANACTEYLATTTAGVPLKVTDPAGNDEHASPIGHFLTIAPNLIADVTRSAMVFGRFYLRKVYNPSGYPTGLKYLNPLTMREVDDGRGRLAYYELMLETGGRETLRPQDVIYKQVFDPRPFGNGLSKFEAAWLALNIEQSVSTYAAAFFVNGAQPDGFLTFTDPLSDDEYEEARREWQKNHKGAKNGHRTAVMPGGATWTATSSVPKDLAMIELKRAEREDICAVFEVDPILVGLKDAADPLSANSTYSSAEIAHLRRVTLPFLKMIVLPALNDQWAQRDFEPRGHFTLAVDESAIPALVDAQLVKSETAINLSGGGLLDYAESRKLLGYGERETGYLIRKPDEALALWQASGLTLNALHTLVFGQSYLGANGEVVLLGGQLYPVGALAEVAAANVEKLKAPPVSPFGLSAPPAPALAQDVTATTPQPLQLPPARAAYPLEIAVSFAGNQFVRYARRTLSDALTALRIKATWVFDDDWRLTLARTEQWTANALAALMRTADYAETKKVDARLVGFVQRGDAIYARLEGAVESLQKAVGLDLRAAGLSAETSIDGVLLCTIDGRADELPTLDFPLVLNNVSIYTGTDVYHAWALRAASTAQAKELANAENVLRRKGREHGFTFEALAGTEVETWVRSALDAGCELDDLFAVARAIQAGEITVRAYPETRDGFVSAVTELFMAAQNETTDRRNFAAQFRVQLRRTGLTAFRDGMNKVNYNPESYSPQELATFREWLDRQSGYVTGLGFELFKGGGIQANEVANRVRMWADISLNEIYYQGIAAGSKTQRMLWIYDTEANHCPDCPRLNGQIHTMEEWLKAGFLPGNGHTDCKQGCRCRLEPTDDAPRGTF